MGKWTEKEIETLKAKYPLPDMTLKDVAKELGREENSVRNKIWELKLKKNGKPNGSKAKTSKSEPKAKSRPVHRPAKEARKSDSSKDIAGIVRECLKITGMMKSISHEQTKVTAEQDKLMGMLARLVK